MTEHDGELEPLVPTPQDWGLPEKPTLSQRGCWDNQQRFLRRYAERGKLALSAADCGLHVSAVERWQSADLYGFNKRLEYAYQAYREMKEEENEEWVRESNHNTQIYRIFHMKGIWPEKYRDDVKVQGLEPITQLLEEARKLAARDIQRREALEGGAAEGQYREVDGSA